MVVSEAARLTMLGIVPGLIGAWAAARVGAFRLAMRAARVNPISALTAD